jgi:hypothetical protein
MLRAFASAVVLMLLVGTTLAPATVAAPRGGVLITTTLTGEAEVPGPGDPDGLGTASLTFNPGREEVCFELSVSNITLPATGAHIHSGTATQSGGVVVHLIAPDGTGTSSGCVSADRELIVDIIRNPENYYVNVHTLPMYAAGAVRGQLG